MNTIQVHADRFNCGAFQERRGDISEAYSAHTMPKVKVFTHDGKLWTNTGGFGSTFRPHATCYPLILLAEYTGPESVARSAEGRTVTYKGQKFRLGPSVEFEAIDRTVDDWRRWLRNVYTHGGYFTVGKTYHDWLHEEQRGTAWDCNKRDFVPHAGNVIAAIRLELKQPDWTKHGKKAAPAPVEQPQTQLQLI